MSWLRLWTVFLVYGVASTKRRHLGTPEEVLEADCQISDELKREIEDHKPLVDKITTEVINGPYAGVFYNDLASFTDRFGYRKTGTQALENSIRHLSNVLKEKKLRTKVESVEVPLWLRGKQMAFYIDNFQRKRLKIKALGGSASGNVTGQLIIVKDLDELDERHEEVKRKIVLFNSEFTSYSDDIANVLDGPSRASHFGAVGVLVRSLTPFSLGNIHVGLTDFQGVKPIPAASISLEDADMLNRLIQNEVVIVRMVIENKAEEKKTVSHNLIADIPGTSNPANYTILSGHIDSWDVGKGVLDDAGGAFLALHSLLLLKKLNIQPPRRTMRAILWTGGETGYQGAKSYGRAHGEELESWTTAIESDSGLFQPLGFKLNGKQEAACIVKHIVSLFSEINATQARKADFAPADISVFQPLNVPLMEPLMVPNKYFWYHHTDGDSMRAMNSTMMDRHLVLMAGTAYILANLSTPLPREENKHDWPFDILAQPKENEK